MRQGNTLLTSSGRIGVRVNTKLWNQPRIDACKEVRPFVLLKRNSRGSKEKECGESECSDKLHDNRNENGGDDVNKRVEIYGRWNEEVVEVEDCQKNNDPVVKVVRRKK